MSSTESATPRKLYLLFALTLFFFIGMTEFCQQEALSYFFGFKSPASLPESSKAMFEMTKSYPQLTKYYGLLSGFGFYFTYSTFGIIIGQAIDRFNRKSFLGLMVILCSMATLTTAYVDSFAVLCLMRLVLGVTCSAFMPATYSLINDLFPDSWNNRANSVVSCGHYIGGGVSSLYLLLLRR